MRVQHFLGLDRLLDEGHGAGTERAVLAVVGGDHAHRQVARAHVVLDAVEHAPAVHVRQVHVERHGRPACTGWPASARRAPIEVTRPLKPLARAASSRKPANARSFSTISRTRSPAGSCRDRRWPRSAAAPPSSPTTTASSTTASGRPQRARQARRGDSLPASSAVRRAARAARARVHQRQVKREGAALSRRAGQADLAAQQLGQLAADRQAQAGAAVLAAGRAVGLLERLEDDLLLVARDADAGVRHRERNHLLRATRSSLSGSSPRETSSTASVTWP